MRGKQNPELIEAKLVRSACKDKWQFLLTVCDKYGHDFDIVLAAIVLFMVQLLNYPITFSLSGCFPELATFTLFWSVYFRDVLLGFAGIIPGLFLCQFVRQW